MSVEFEENMKLCSGPEVTSPEKITSFFPMTGILWNMEVPMHQY